MDRISKHITFEESIKSQTAIRLGIPNIPDAETIDRMKLVAEKCFEPVREHFGVPIGVSSFYRSTELNKAIGGAINSQHRHGEAIDIDADIYGKVTNLEIFDFIINNLEFDQCISEFPVNGNPSWVHVSYSGRKNRNEILIAYKDRGITKYHTWER